MLSWTRWPLVATGIGLGLVTGLTLSQRLIGQPPAPALPEPVAVAPLPRDWQSFAPVVKRVLPAVVSIEAKARTEATPKPGELDPGFGSGVLIDPAGVVLTNHHVVVATTEVEVTLQDGRKFLSKDIRRDPKSDLAIIRLEPKEALPFLEYADSARMEVGDRVLAVGAPFGLTGSVTSGIVSGKSRDNLNLNLYEDFIQTDAAVNPGNSGGPLVNMEGKVVGITAAIKTRSGGFQGVGLAVSSNLAKSVSDQLIKNGVVRRPYLGVLVSELDEATATKLKIKPDAGVVITKVFAKSPGEKANLGVGDVITTLNGQLVPTARAMQKATLALPVGEVVEAVVLRNGQPFLTRLTVEDQPDDFGTVKALKVAGLPVSYDHLGLAVVSLSPELSNRMGLPKSIQGVVVSGVTRNGLAEQSGLVRGQLIVRANKAAISTAEELRQIVEQGERDRGVVLQVLTPNGNVDFVILKLQ